ncbi:MucBP domain-containing protein, partial [Lactobacillus gallinarum]|uniref:mucin-binding protein n=1 Tax=Lactobacillus gallinarum TaxID=52242 RepID=UPI0025A46CE7
MEEKFPYTYKREKQRFSIRKTKAWGACSVFLGTSILFLSAGTVARADTTADASTRAQVVEQKTTVNTGSTGSAESSANSTSSTVSSPSTDSEAEATTPNQNKSTATNTEKSASETQSSSQNSASSSSAAKAETTSASSSSAAKAETTSASSSSAAKAETTSAKTRQTVTKISYNTLLQQLRTSKALATDKEAPDKEALTHVTKDNFLDYFSLNGSATYDPNTGIVTITPDENDKVGNFSLKSKIDMNSSFTLTGQVNLGNKTSDWGGADGIGFAFHNGNTTDVGNAGGNLGIGGLQNAIGFKLDTWHNDRFIPKATVPGAQVSSTDSNGFGWSQDPDTFNPQFGAFVPVPQFGAFVTTDSKEITAIDGNPYQRWWATTDMSSVQKLSSYDLDGEFHNFVVSYDGDSRLLTIKYTEATANVLTWKKTVDSSYQAMAMIISASTGGATNLQQFKIKSFKFKQAATVNVKYVDTKGNQIAQGEVTYPNGANVNGTYTTEQLEIPNYKFVRMDDGTATGAKSLPANGTLTKAGDNGTVIYVYAPSKTIRETIKYIDQNGKAVAKGYTADPITFVTVTNPVDNTTTTYYSTKAKTATLDLDDNGVPTEAGWTKADSTDFAEVTSPAIKGYTPDKAEIPAIKVNADSDNIERTVTYKANKQKLDVAFIDDTTGETLKTVTKDGVSDGSANYNTKNDIDGYKAQHYNIVSDSTNGQDLIFDHDDNVDQTYEVHFVHGTHTINQTTSPKQTIHYVYADDLARQGKAADDNVQQLSFKRDGYNDEVTGVDYWNAWTPANSNYSAVDSPVIQGYTPDKSVIEKSTVNPTDKDTEITVTYNADKQAARVIYVDTTTNATLTSNNLSGKSDKDSGYNTKDTIGKYKSQHYVLTGDETNGKNVIFDHDDKQDQTYYVYFVHGTRKVNRQDTVTSTIDYKFEDGKTAQPTVTQTKHFSEDGVKDLVTGKITWDEAEPQKFDDIATKSIVGYTPDTDNVAGSTVNFGDKDIEVTVTYHNNAQTAKITYIDDTTKTNLDSKDANGKFNQAITFATAPTDEIANYEKQGYVLVSNSFHNQTYAADNNKNVFYVHLKHKTENVTRNDTVTRTIHYLYDNGNTAQPDKTQTVSFNETGTKDDVTGKTTWSNDNAQTVDNVDTPSITGYTPDKSSIEKQDFKFGDQDVEVTVTY